MYVPPSVGLLGGAGGKHDTEKGTDEAGDPVQVVDAASVVDLELPLQPWGEVVIAHDGDEAGNGADDHGAKRLNEQVGHGTDGHTAGQGRVLDVLLKICEGHFVSRSRISSSRVLL